MNPIGNGFRPRHRARARVDAGATPAPQLGPAADRIARTAASDRLRAVVRDGIEQGVTEQAVLDRVIEDELRSCFGEHASPEMIAAVRQAAGGDPGLRTMLDRVWKEVSDSPAT